MDDTKNKQMGPFSIIVFLILLLVALVLGVVANIIDGRCRSRADEIFAAIDENVEKVIVRNVEHEVAVKIVYQGTAGQWEIEFQPLKGCFFDKQRLVKKGLIKADILNDDQGREVWIRAPDSS